MSERKKLVTSTADLVTRLRMDAEPTEGDMEDAADEIERLREALRRIVEYCANDGLPNEIVAERVIDRVDEEARAALKECSYE